METEIIAKAELQPLNNEEDVLQCPTCDKKIKRAEMAEHCRIEMERLQQQNSASANLNEEAATTNNESTSSGRGREERRRPWTVFQRVQRNRQARQKQRSRKRTTPPPPPVETNCPVCNKSFTATEIQRHAYQCLRQNGRSSSGEDDDYEEYEEYEWAGQKRIRVSTLVPGGFATLGLGQTIKYNGNQQTNDDEDEDLNVDEDDTHIYGPTQYGEGDVIPLASDDSGGAGGSAADSDVTSYMRRLIASGDSNNTNHSNEANASSGDSSNNSTNLTNEINEVTPAQSQPSAVSDTTLVSEPDEFASTSSNMLLDKSPVKSIQHYEHVIDSLKAKLRLYESQIQSKFKCLICIDDYKNPAISVTCWHVYCEQCWLRTLGARKLCPQCNSITTPKDLRRIYL